MGDSTKTEMPSPCRGGALQHAIRKEPKLAGRGSLAGWAGSHVQEGLPHSNQQAKPGSVDRPMHACRSPVPNNAVAQHQSASLGASPDQRLNGGDKERHRLAGAGLGARHHIATLQHLWRGTGGFVDGREHQQSTDKQTSAARRRPTHMPAGTGTANWCDQQQQQQKMEKQQHNRGQQQVEQCFAA